VINEVTERRKKQIAGVAMVMVAMLLNGEAGISQWYLQNKLQAAVSPVTEGGRTGLPLCSFKARFF